MDNNIQYRFSFGPWNINEGADPFGSPARSEFPHEEKFALYKPLGFDGVQFHDDDVVPDLDKLSLGEISLKAKTMAEMLGNQGLEAEFVAPRLWFASETIDGAYTSNNSKDREYATTRTKISVDIAHIIGAKAIVLWLARDGTYIREAKDVCIAYERILELINTILDYDDNIEIWIEPKPNEPMDLSYVPTAGHAISMAYASNDEKRVKVLIESAHAILSGLDPSEEMGFALAHDKLAGVHLNDQNGLKYDQDKNFSSVNLRAAFNQVLVMEKNNYGQNGEFVGLDVKTIRTQPGCPVLEHLKNSRTLFLDLVEKARNYDWERVIKFRENRDYEGLELYTMRHLMGIE